MAALNDDQLNQFRVWIRDDVKAPGIHRSKWVLLKNGPRVYKSASLLFCGDDHDDLTSVEVQFQTSRLGPDGFYRATTTGPDGEVRDKVWGCTLEELRVLIGLIEAEDQEGGKYSLIEARGNASTVLDYLRTGDLSSGFLASIAQALIERVDRVSDLSEVEGIELISAAADLGRQRQVTDEFEAAVLDPRSLEGAFQKQLDLNWWLLGANYIGKLDRKRFTALDTYDMALVRADNVVHIVELKQANIPNLVVPEHKHFSVGVDINKAVNQAANYLRAVDEQRAEILAEFGVECRRAQATVIIGHPDHNHRDDVTPAQVREAIRTYNSHLSRIEVLTYEDVIATARNSIRHLAQQVQNDSTYVEIDPDDHRPPTPALSRVFGRPEPSSLDGQAAKPTNDLWDDDEDPFSFGDGEEPF